MANILYRKLANGDWLNQASPGSAALFTVRQSPQDGLYYAYLSWDVEHWYQFNSQSDATPAGMQTKLDAYMASVNAGTA